MIHTPRTGKTYGRRFGFVFALTDTQTSGGNAPWNEILSRVLVKASQSVRVLPLQPEDMRLLSEHRSVHTRSFSVFLVCVRSSLYLCVCWTFKSPQLSELGKRLKKASSMFQEVPLPRLVSSFIQTSWGLWRRWDVKKKGSREGQQSPKSTVTNMQKKKKKQRGDSWGQR